MLNLLLHREINDNRNGCVVVCVCVCVCVLREEEEAGVSYAAKVGDLLQRQLQREPAGTAGGQGAC